MPVAWEAIGNIVLPVLKRSASNKVNNRFELLRDFAPSVEDVARLAHVDINRNEWGGTVKLLYSDGDGFYSAQNHVCS